MSHLTTPDLDDLQRAQLSEELIEVLAKYGMRPMRYYTMPPGSWFS